MPHAPRSSSTAVPPDRADPALERAYRDDASWLRAQLRRRFGQSVGHTIDDLIQDAFVRALSAAGAPMRHPRAFLLQVASRLALDALRRSRRAPIASAETDGAVPASAPCDLPDAETAILLKQVILAMPELYRDVFVLARFEGLSYQEIATLRGVSVKTVEWRMSRALACCAAALAP